MEIALVVNNLGRTSNLKICIVANAAIRYLSEWVMVEKVHGLHVMCECVCVCVCRRQMSIEGSPYLHGVPDEMTGDS